MNCWHCDRPAHATCQFCGRGVCREHVKDLPRIVAIYRSGQGTHKALVVGDAAWCGVCHPREDPVELPELG
jgi:hypothetical protein